MESIEATAKWKEQVEEIVALNDSPIPMVLAVNKVDLVEDKLQRNIPLEDFQTQEWLDQFAEESGFIGCQMVSAKNDTNISQIFTQLVREMLIKEITERQQEQETPNEEEQIQNERVRLGQTAAKQEKKKGCC